MNTKWSRSLVRRIRSTRRRCRWWRPLHDNRWCRDTNSVYSRSTRPSSVSTVRRWWWGYSGRVTPARVSTGVKVCRVVLGRENTGGEVACQVNGRSIDTDKEYTTRAEYTCTLYWWRSHEYNLISFIPFCITSLSFGPPIYFAHLLPSSRSHFYVSLCLSLHVS